MRKPAKCKEGDIVWKCNRKLEVKPLTIVKVEFVEYAWKGPDEGHYVYYAEDDEYYLDRSFKSNLFKTKEEAEEKAERSRKANTKRLMLLEYEEKLNEMLGLKDHFLIRKNKGE